MDGWMVGWMGAWMDGYVFGYGWMSGEAWLRVTIYINK